MSYVGVRMNTICTYVTISGAIINDWLNKTANCVKFGRIVKKGRIVKE